MEYEQFIKKKPMEMRNIPNKKVVRQKLLIFKNHMLKKNVINVLKFKNK